MTLSFSTTAVVNSPPGTYPIVPAVSGASSNYTVAIVNAFDDHVSLVAVNI